MVEGMVPEGPDGRGHRNFVKMLISAVMSFSVDSGMVSFLIKSSIVFRYEPNYCPKRRGGCQGWAFGHWTIRTAELGSDKIASARLLVGQTPQKRSDKLGQSDSFGQLGSLSDNSALLGHSDSSDNSDKAEPSFPRIKLTRFDQ